MNPSSGNFLTGRSQIAMGKLPPSPSPVDETMVYIVAESAN